MKPTIKDLQHKLAMQYSRTLELESELKRLKGSPKVQEQLSMDNKNVHDLMEQNAQLKDDLVNANSDVEKLIKTVNEVTAENNSLKASQTLTVQEQQPLVVNHYHNCVINK
jgi:predicted RNase H-like nuclease (RuvC/YqgF family)